jgi:hypothetical protein
MAPYGLNVTVTDGQPVEISIVAVLLRFACHIDQAFQGGVFQFWLLGRNPQMAYLSFLGIAIATIFG